MERSSGLTRFVAMAGIILSWLCVMAGCAGLVVARLLR